MENLNYYWLKNNSDREKAFDDIVSSLNYRVTDSLDLRNGITSNTDIESSTAIFKQLRNIVIVVYKDDLYRNNTYLHILVNFCKITNNPFPIELNKLSDNYLFTEESKDFLLSFESKGKVYQIELKKGKYLDYNFLKPIVNAVNESSSKGNFYLVDDEQLEDGYCFIYLDEIECLNFTQKNIIRVKKLTHELIDDINIWSKK